MNATACTPAHITRRLALAILGMAAALFALLSLSACSSTPDLQAFEDAFAEQEADLLEGVALDDYVNPSDYGFSFDLSEPETEDGVTTTNGTVTVANDSFQTIYDVKGTYQDDTFTFSVDEGPTTPIAGVDFDDEHDFNGAESELTGDDTCEVTTTETIDTWFATLTFNRTYHYKFENDGVGQYWAFTGEDVNSSDIQYKDGALDGSYSYSSDSMSEGSFTTFQISDFNADDGTFTVSYANKYASGTAQCTLETIELDEDSLEQAQDDGTAVADAYQFHFVGDSPEDRDVTIEGYLSQDDNSIVSNSWLPSSGFEVMGYTQVVYGTVSGTLVK